MTRYPGVLTFALLLVLVSGSASALDLTPRDVHLRAGFSLKPDQFHAGVQARIGSTERIVFRPSLDLGLGNGVTLVTLNGDVLYRFERTSRMASRWSWPGTSSAASTGFPRRAAEGSGISWRRGGASGTPRTSS
jgi:hypothetical protein